MLLRVKYMNINKLLNALIVLYAFSLPLSKALTTLLELLIVVLWIARPVRKNDLEIIFRSPLIVWLIVFVLFGLVAVSWSSDKLFALDYLAKYHHFLLVPVIITILDKDYVDNAIFGFLAGNVISVFASLGVFWGVLSIEGVPSTDPSPFMDHANHSVYLAFSAIIAMHLSFIDKTRKALFLILMTLFVVNLFLLAGRTGQVIFVVSLILYLFMVVKNKLQAMVLSGIIVSLVLCFSYYFSPIFKKRVNAFVAEYQNVFEKGDYSGSFSRRVSLWVMGWNVFLDNPILGTGIGDERTGMNKYAKKYNFKEYISEQDFGYIDYHNAFIQYSVQLGVVGMITFIGMLLALWSLRIENPKYAPLSKMFVLMFVMFSMVGLTMHIMSSMVLFALFSGLFLRLEILEANKTKTT